MIIQDNGNLTATNSITKGFGMAGMKARCDRIHGSFIVESSIPQGMKITVTLPLNSTSLEGGTT